MSGEAVGIPRGLPGRLPPGERILWQGAPDAAALARAAFHTRAVAIYFAVLIAIGLGLAIAHGTRPIGAAETALCGMLAVALLRLLAWGAAGATVYTLTDRRIVLRIGTALPKSINLPLDKITAVGLSDGGDVVLTLGATPPIGWAMLWPHARPWRLSRPEPMLRCLPDAETAAARIGRACLERAPDGRLRAPAVPTAPVHGPVLEPVAA